LHLLRAVKDRANNGRVLFLVRAVFGGDPQGGWTLHYDNVTFDER
jgi:hypothetical protein